MNPGFSQEFKKEDHPVIIGFSARLPACHDFNDFWQLLVNQNNAISQTPANRLKHMKVHWAGFIERVDEFDFSFFNISSLEASVMDPQQRLLLQEVWRALSMAGLDLNSLKGSSTGVYVGASTFDYAKLLSRYQIKNPYLPFASAPGLLANRISYCFDLCGPSETIDTDCSSSLCALDKAVSALKQGEIEQAIVCGVNLLLDDEFFNGLAELGLLSSTNRCRPFDSEADGYLRGEGIIVVILQNERLALEKKNAIYAKILASGVRHSGQSIGLHAPNQKAQQDLYECVYRGLDLKRLSYIEANATGIALSDAIELEAWKKFIDNNQSLMIKIGSLKSSIGHLEAASGLAGVIKILLMFHHKIIPQQAHLNRINPYFSLEEIGISFCLQNQIWPSPLKPYMASVSSFGFGGVHAHVVLEQGSALYETQAIIRAPFPFLRKKLWFHKSSNEYLYEVEQRCVDEKLRRLHLTDETILVLHSPSVDVSVFSKGLARSNTVLSLVLDEDIATQLANTLQENPGINRVIIYQDISVFLWEQGLRASLPSLSLLFIVLKTILHGILASINLRLDVYTYCKDTSNTEHPSLIHVWEVLSSFSKSMTHWQIKHIHTDEALNLNMIESNFLDVHLPIVHHQGHFLTNALTKAHEHEEEEFLQDRATYLIINFMDGIFEDLIQFLLKPLKAKLILISKKSLDERASLLLESDAEDLEFIQTDISSESQCNLLIKYLSIKYPTLDAVFFQGKASSGIKLECLTWEDLEEEILAIESGIRFIRQLQQNLKPKSLVMFSCTEGNAVESLSAYPKDLALYSDLKLKLVNWGFDKACFDVEKNNNRFEISTEDVWDALQKGLNGPYTTFAVCKRVINQDVESMDDLKRMEGFFEVVSL